MEYKIKTTKLGMDAVFCYRGVIIGTLTNTMAKEILAECLKAVFISD